MESMDYNYFATNGHQPYQYMNYGGDSTLLHPGVSNDIAGPVSGDHFAASDTPD